jgi:hypothetical protein
MFADVTLDLRRGVEIIEKMKDNGLTRLHQA